MILHPVGNCQASVYGIASWEERGCYCVDVEDLERSSIVCADPSISVRLQDLRTCRIKHCHRQSATRLMQLSICARIALRQTPLLDRCVWSVAHLWYR